MEYFIIFLIIVRVFVGLFFAIMFYEKTKDKRASNKAKKIEEKSNANNSRILKEETIVVNNDGENEEIVLKILEENGDIKRVDNDIVTNKGNNLWNLKGNIDTFWGDCDDGPIPGNSIFICHDNVIITKTTDNIVDETYYYMNINNIKKITRKNGYFYFSDSEGKWSKPTATFTIFTKSNNSLELVYPNDILIPDENCPVVLKKINDNIIFEYTYDMDDKNIDVKYDFDDAKLRIGESSHFNPKYAYYGKYEIVVNYVGILTKDIINKDGILNVIIETKNNYKYILVFIDDEKAAKFYNELKNH